MDSYFDKTFKLMATMGLRIHDKKDGILFRMLTLITIGVPFSSAIQEIATLFVDTNIDHKMREFPCLLVVCEAIVEIFTILRSRTILSKLLNDLDGLYQDMSEKEKEIHDKFTLKYQKLAFVYGAIALFAVCSFNILPAVRTLHSAYFDEIPVSYSPFFFWFPFNKQDYLVQTYLYEALCGYTSVMVSVMWLQLFILLVSQIAGQFRHLSEKLVNIINAYDDEKLTESPKESLNASVRDIIVNHCKLIEYTEKVDEIFGLVCFVIITLGCIMVCFTGFCVAVSRLTIQ